MSQILTTVVRTKNSQFVISVTFLDNNNRLRRMSMAGSTLEEARLSLAKSLRELYDLDLPAAVG